MGGVGRVSRVGRTLVIGAAGLLLLTLGLKAATETSLLEAVKRGDVGAVRTLLGAKSEVETNSRSVRILPAGTW